MKIILRQPERCCPLPTDSKESQIPEFNATSMTRDTLKFPHLSWLYMKKKPELKWYLHWGRSKFFFSRTNVVIFLFISGFLLDFFQTTCVYLLWSHCWWDESSHLDVAFCHHREAPGGFVQSAGWWAYKLHCQTEESYVRKMGQISAERNLQQGLTNWNKNVVKTRMKTHCFKGRLYWIKQGVCMCTWFPVK